MAAGFRVLARQRKVDSDTVSQFAKLPVANVSDSMSRMTRAARGCGRCTARVAWPARR